MKIVVVVSAACAIMMVLIANLLLKPQATKRFFVLAGGAANFLGFFLYGYGYSIMEKNTLMAILKTLFAVFGMFLGKDSFGDMSKLPFFSFLPVKFFFYMAQILALYVTASAAMTAFGAGFINRVRGLLLRRGELNIFPFVNEHTLYLGSELCSQGEKVLFICDKSTSSEVLEKIRDMRAVHTAHNAAFSASEIFLKTIGMERPGRQVTLFAVGNSAMANITYARSFRKSMKNLRIPTADTRLILCANEYFDITSLMHTDTHYGFENVRVFEDTALAARIMITDCPPYKTITFDENACANEDFHVMIVGFGTMGQAALKALVMHGQFVGSHFSAMIFDPAGKSRSGAFNLMYEGMLSRYDISFSDKDGRSEEAFDYLRRHARDLRYIVIATGGQTDSELEYSYASILHSVNPSAYLISCRSSDVTEIRTEEDGIVRKTWPLYNIDIVSGETMDRRAMELNQHYCGDNGKTAKENWIACDYFNRLSSEASADFVPAFLYMAGRTKEEVLQNGLALTKKQEETLWQTEHERWCAFLFAHRYRTMTLEEWNARAELYAREKAEKGFSDIKIGKNRRDRTHACLIPWEELPALDLREQAVTGIDPDYQEIDRHMIQLIPQLLE
ncbi:MAG TPA: hypothetical protein DCG37_02080 [Lachnospiraceae bacterium]|nr:hypothetical protein [Lachnospiraceae bacterium]